MNVAISVNSGFKEPVVVYRRGNGGSRSLPIRKMSDRQADAYPLAGACSVKLGGTPRRVSATINTTWSEAQTLQPTAAHFGFDLIGAKNTIRTKEKRLFINQKYA